MRVTRLIAGFALAAAATAVFATVSFDTATGIGWVGKGDVQTPFGWRDQTMQQNHAGVTFDFVMSESYEAVCVFVTGEGTRGERTHRVDHKVKVAVSGVADDLDRIQKTKTAKFTGWFLKGYLAGSAQVTGEVPVVGGPCMGNDGHDGLWGAVSAPIPGTDGGLYAAYVPLGLRTLLTITPPVTTTTTVTP
jgi:hypothetical protein